MSLELMKVLQVTSSVNPEAGGVSAGSLQQSLVLRSLGDEVSFLTLDAPDSPWLKDFPLPVYGVGPAKGVFSYTPNLLPWLKENADKYDAIVVNGLWQFQGYACRKWLKKIGKPYVIYSHGMLDPYFNQDRAKHLKKIVYWLLVEYRVLRDAYSVLFTTEEEEHLAATSFRPYKIKGKVVGYGTLAPEGDRKTWKEQFFSSFPQLRDHRFLLFLSRIHPKKGCDLLIEAFARNCKEDKDLFLVIAGPDQVGIQDELMKVAESFGIADRVIWPGMITGNVKWGAYCACEAFILPSHQENFGMVVAEAAACGTPVLISNKVNIWREIQEEGAGVVEEDTLTGTSNLLTRWFALNEQEREAMSEKAVKCFDAHFELRASTVRLRDVIGEMSSQTPESSGKDRDRFKAGKADC